MICFVPKRTPSCARTFCYPSFIRKQIHGLIPIRRAWVHDDYVLFAVELATGQTGLEQLETCCMLMYTLLTNLYNYKRGRGSRRIKRLAFNIGDQVTAMNSKKKYPCKILNFSLKWGFHLNGSGRIDRRPLSIDMQISLLPVFKLGNTGLIRGFLLIQL